jgi:hypothetical protein
MTPQRRQELAEREERSRRDSGDDALAQELAEEAAEGLDDEEEDIEARGAALL